MPLLLFLISSDSKSYVLIFINCLVFTVVDEFSGEKKKVHFVMEKEHQHNNNAQIEMSRELILKRLQEANMCDQTLKEGQICYLKSKKILGLR